MKNDEYIEFLRRTRIKIENAFNLLKQSPPRHILAYHKALGIYTKLDGLDEKYKKEISLQLITAKSIINYLINGRYIEANNQIIKLKLAFDKISLEAQKNERDNNK